jgi:hypothetical protein
MLNDDQRSAGWKHHTAEQLLDRIESARGCTDPDDRNPWSRARRLRRFTPTRRRCSCYARRAMRFFPFGHSGRAIGLFKRRPCGSFDADARSL